MNEQSGHLDDPATEKAQRIGSLIVKYLGKDITSQEHDELNEWVGECDENMLTFEELTDDLKLKQAVDWLDEETESPKMLKRLKGQLIFARYYRPIRLFSQSWHYGVAALLLLVFGLSAFVIHRDDFDKTLNASAVLAQPELLPGSPEKAILTLDDGSTIILDQTKDGMLASQGNSEINKKNGQIEYNNSKALKKSNEVLYNTVTTPRGGSYPLTLSDGTKVWLNAASSIKFPATFTGKERKVTITGEVYFEVAKNKNMPFKVEVKDKMMQVQVLGTHFNINAYNDESVVKTTLLEGSVKIYTSEKVNSLAPGQQFQYGPNNVKVIPNVDVEEVVAWKNGFFRFKNADINAIMKQVSRWYNVDVSYQGQANNIRYDCLLSKDISALNLFYTLEESGGVRFKIEGNNIIVLL